MDESRGVKLGGWAATKGGEEGAWAGVARRWRWPVRAAAWGGGALTAFAFLCPPLFGRSDALTVAVTQAACMLRTFGLQCGVGAAAGACAARLLGARRTAALALAAAVVWLVPEGLKWVPRGAPAVAVGDTLTVLSVNALYGRSDPRAIASEAGACAADVIVFQEYTPELAGALRDELVEFPHRVEMAREDGFGQAVFSRRAFVGQGRVYASWSRQPQITVAVNLAGAPVRVTDVHLLSPVGLGVIAEQRREATGLAAEVGAERGSGDRVLAGDFNATTDGHVLRPLLGEGMIDSWRQARVGRGGTWPSDGVPSVLGRVRIDNLLHSGGLVCVGAGVGGRTGSDHLPTWCRYARAQERGRPGL